MTEKLDKYLLDIEIDNETGEEHCTVLKTDGTTNMNDWITIISAMYTHHSVFEPLIKELNKLSEENEQLKSYTGEMEDYLARLEEKNEQLKADKQSLIDFIRKEFPKSHKHILEGFE